MFPNLGQIIGGPCFLQLESLTITRKNDGAGGAIRARDLWTGAVGPHCSPDYESGALARLGYPGKLPPFF